MGVLTVRFKGRAVFDIWVFILISTKIAHYACNHFYFDDVLIKV